MSGGEPRVAMISGASRGIGLAIARELRAHGYALSLGVRDPGAIPDDIAGDRVLACEYDALGPDAAQAWLDATITRFGQLDVLVNNAGIGLPTSIRDLDAAAVETVWRVDALGPLVLTSACLPHLEETGHGRIVNIVSLSGKRVRNENVGYAMAKFAQLGLTHSTRHISWETGVRVTAICPSFVRTEATAGVTKVARDDMIAPETIARIARTVIELPNEAAIAEVLVNCRLEDAL